jgi:uncharacterized protein
MSTRPPRGTARPGGAPLPEFDPLTRFYWTSGADGVLRILRCHRCDRWVHPPTPCCLLCGNELAAEPVSGRGSVASWTVNHHPWTQGMEVPFIIAVIELLEQARLYVVSNLACAPEEVYVGLPVVVLFEPVEDVWFPVFRPVGS